MKYQYIPYVWLLFISGFISLSLGCFTLFKRRSAKGSVSFILSMLVVTVWSVANALEMSGTDLRTKLFWANVQYFAFCYSPVTLLALCMQFTGYDVWIKSRKILWVAAVPSIILILVWTDGFHGLIRHNIHLDYSGPFPVIAKEYGPAFFLHAIYSHALNITAWVLLMRAAFYRKSIYRKQVLALLIGVSFIVIPNVLYISGLSPIDGFDITPVFFGPAGLIMYWGIFRFRMFDLVPLARDTVIESMEAGVMVLDLQDRIIDMNPACFRILDLPASSISPVVADAVLGRVPELVRVCKDRTASYSEFTLEKGEEQRVYEVILSPLTSKKGSLLGRLAVIYDITEKKRVQQEMLEQQWKLAVKDERERMARDMHDNLGQVLGFINMQAQGIRQELVNEGIVSVSEKLDKLAEAARSAHSDIREFIHNIRSSSGKDFMTSLLKDIRNFEEMTGIETELIKPDGFTGEELRPDMSVNLLNIIREALNNIRKHAKAKHVTVSFSIKEGQLKAAVRDDGKGYVAGQKQSLYKSRFGLDIMRERASEIGGQIRIESGIGKGSAILLEVPLDSGRKRLSEAKKGLGEETYESDAGG